MASDRFTPSSPESLASSTAITPVTEDAFEQAGRKAARLVGAPGKRGPRSPRKSEATVLAEPTVAPDLPAAASTGDESIEAPILSDTIVEPMAEGAAQVGDCAVIAAEDAADAIAATPSDVIDPVPGPVANEANRAEPPAETSSLQGTKPLEASDPMAQWRGKLASAIQTNIAASVDFWMAMTTATSPAEAIEINTRHLNHQVEAFVAQSRELSALARHAAMASMRSIVGPS